MKLLICNDLHLTSYQPAGRKDNILATSLRKMSEILLIAERRNVIRILIAGDLVDRPRDWPLVSQLSRILSTTHIPIMAIRGQHDIYMRSSESNNATTVGVLENMGAVRILDYGPHLVYSDLAIYGCGWGEPIQEPRLIDDRIHILVIHAPISDRALYPGHDYLDATDFINKYAYDLVLCGDAHRRFNIISKGGQKRIINTGPILRVKADAYNQKLHPAVAIYDTKTRGVEWVELSIEKDVFKTEHIEQAKEQNLILSEFIAAVQNPDIGIGVPMIERVRTWAQNNGECGELIDLLSDVCGIPSLRIYDGGR